MSFHATPITVLTGFLGSGKTTLVNRLLSEDHGLRLAIIENEYGEIGIDAELITRESDETIVQLANGCVCCTVRGDLANALAKLVADRDAGLIQFDQVVIETTGLADPGPIVRTFLAETAILDHFYLDGVVTLVDGVGNGQVLAQRREARSQLAYADHVIVTKCDLISAPALAALQVRLRAMNSAASVEAVALTSDAANLSRLLQIKGYQPDRPRLDGDVHDQYCGHHHEDHASGHDCASHGGTADDPAHLERVRSIAWSADHPLDRSAFEAAMAAIIDQYPETLWRVKGILDIAGIRQRVIVQGVNGLMQVNPTTYWRPFEPRRSRLVLIGEGLDTSIIMGCLDDCVAKVSLTA